MMPVCSFGWVSSEIPRWLQRLCRGLACQSKHLCPRESGGGTKQRGEATL